MFNLTYELNVKVEPDFVPVYANMAAKVQPYFYSLIVFISDFIPHMF